MAIGDGVSGEGATQYVWTPPVRRVVQLALSRIPQMTANTYECHPWCGWERLSVDFWGPGGRGDPIPAAWAVSSLDFLFNLPGPPLIRHYIYLHTLWTSFGGNQYWSRDDHSGRLRHLHVTYWPVGA